MVNIMLSLRDRIKDFLTAYSKLTVAYTANTDPAVIKVADARLFNVWWAMRDYPQAFIKDKTTGTVYNVKIIKVDQAENEITLEKPIDGNLAIDSVIKRAPNYEEIREVYLGDPSSIPEEVLPAVCIMPDNKKIDWLTLQGTEEVHNFSIITHVKEDNYQNAIITVMRITQDLEDLLNADLHLKIDYRDDKTNQIDGTPPYNKVNNSLCTNTDYGYSMKGTYCMSSKITWFGTEYWFRMHLVQHPEVRVFQKP